MWNPTKIQVIPARGPQTRFSAQLKFSWPTPHAADPSLCSMSFLGTSWHDLSCIGSLVLCHWIIATSHCIIHRKAIQEHILSEFGSHFECLWEPWPISGPPWDLKG